MLKLANNNDSVFLHDLLNAKSAVATRIATYFNCYGTEMSYVYFWYQVIADKITAVVSKIDGNMTIFVSSGCDYDELKEFINIIGYETVFSTEETLDKIGLVPDKTGDILKLKCLIESDINIKISSDINMRKVYELLCDNESDSITKLEYLPWLSDFTFKKNRNSARIVAVEESLRFIGFAMTSAETENSAIISGIVTDKSYRSKGYATALLSTVSAQLLQENKSVFVMTATELNKKFYEKRGFIPIDRWGIIDRKI